MAAAGAMAGAVFGELSAGRDLEHGLRSRTRGLFGRLLGTLGKVLIGAVMIGVIVVAILV